MPLWGICLGFEQLVELIAHNNSVETGGFDSLMWPQ
eukprot:gene13418-14045_t